MACKSRFTKLAKNGKTKTKNENCSWISAVTLSQNYPSGMHILTFPLSHLPNVHVYMCTCVLVFSYRGNHSKPELGGIKFFSFSFITILWSSTDFCLKQKHYKCTFKTIQLKLPTGKTPQKSYERHVSGAKFPPKIAWSWFTTNQYKQRIGKNKPTLRVPITTTIKQLVDTNFEINFN